MNFFAAAIATWVNAWVAIPGGSWSPSSEHLAEIQTRIEPFVKQEAANRHLRLPNWPQYSFQYQGQEEKENKVVFINAYCIAPPAYAKHQFVVVFDGGPCFFQVKYDPKTKQFFQLVFNGEA